MFVLHAYVQARSRELNRKDKRRTNGFSFFVPFFKTTTSNQHLQNNIYAIISAATTTKKFQNPVRIKSTIIPTANQKKAKPHTRLIVSLVIPYYKTVYSGLASFVTIIYSFSRISLTALSTSGVDSSSSSFFWNRSTKSGTISKIFVTVS